MLKKKFLASFKRIVDFFTEKFVNKFKNMGLGSGIQDPGSEIRDPEKTYSGSRIRVQESKRHLIPDLGSRIPDTDPQHLRSPYRDNKHQLMAVIHTGTS
jgi:hypothetical protein